MIHQHLSEFHGLPVVDLDSGVPADQGAWRLSVDYEQDAAPFAEAVADFLSQVDTASVRALVVGSWGEVWENDSAAAVAALAGAAASLPALEAIFFGDLVIEEAEISWIQQSDVTPLLTAFTRLTEFVVRGGVGLELSPVEHEHLRTLRFESGGLPADVVRAVGASKLPALHRLDMWLGVADYGANWEVDDLRPIVDGAGLPALRHLGLCDSKEQDGIAALVATAAVVPRLDVLDLSMGVLTDEGGAALLGGQPLTHLDKLDLHHHFMSDEMVARIKAALEPAGVLVNLENQLEPDTSYGNEPYYYAEVTE